MTDRPVFRTPHPGMPVTLQGPHGPFDTHVTRVVWQNMKTGGSALVEVDCGVPKQLVTISQDQIRDAAGWEWDCA